MKKNLHNTDLEIFFLKLNFFTEVQHGGDRRRTEERISKFEVRTIEITESEQHRESRLGKKKKSRASDACGTTTKDLTFMPSEFQKERKNLQRGMWQTLQHECLDSGVSPKLLTTDLGEHPGQSPAQAEGGQTQ